MPGLTSAYFDLPGLRMHAVVAGPGDGPLLILLHGFPESWYSWRKQIGPLAEAGYRVIAPDQRGYNLSDKSPPYDLKTLVNDIVHLIQACGHEKAGVIGHDWGAAVGWGLAGGYPEWVRKLAILNVPHPIAMEHALRRGNLSQLLKSWYILYFQIPALSERSLKAFNFAAMRRMMNLSSRPGTFTAEDFKHYRSAWMQPGAIPAMLGWYRALLLRDGRSLRWARHLQRIPAPTLIIWGERDIALSVELAGQSVPFLAEGRLIRFPEATHWVHQEYPEEINRYLLAHFGPA